jgi:hypothetical protein
MPPNHARMIAYRKGNEPMTETARIATVAYLTNVAASLEEAIRDLKAEPGDCQPTAFTRWLSDFQAEADTIIGYELPALKCYEV